MMTNTRIMNVNDDEYDNEYVDDEYDDEYDYDE